MHIKYGTRVIKNNCCGKELDQCIKANGYYGKLADKLIGWQKNYLIYVCIEMLTSFAKVLGY